MLIWLVVASSSVVEAVRATVKPHPPQTFYVESL